MASTRLTKAIRESILDALIIRAFKDRSEKHFEKELDFCQRVYDDIMVRRTVRLENGSGDKVTLRSAVDALPPGWGSSGETFKVEFAGQSTKIDRYDGLEQDYRANATTFVGMTFKHERNRPQWTFQPGVTSHSTLDVFPADNPFSEEFTVLTNARTDLRDEVARVTASTRATLESCTTIQKLIVMWPEVEPFAAPFLNPSKAAEVMLPVVQRDALNDVLGLPTGAKEVA